MDFHRFNFEYFQFANIYKQIYARTHHCRELPEFSWFWLFRQRHQSKQVVYILYARELRFLIQTLNWGKVA